MSDRITSAGQLKAGDVVTVAVAMRDQDTGGTRWWKRFAVVFETPVWDDAVRLLTLKMRPDLDKDLRDVDLERDVVHLLPEEQWPQGVIAMRMKLLHTRVLKLRED